MFVLSCFEAELVDSLDEVFLVVIVRRGQGVGGGLALFGGAF
jgi:hypothetical protein